MGRKIKGFEIRQAPAVELSTKTKPVKKADLKFWVLTEKMKKTLISQIDPPGVGLSANQIGSNLAVFAAKIKGEIRIFVNPKIVKKSQKILASLDGGVGEDNENIGTRGLPLEGCLSIKNYWGVVKRYAWVELEYQQFLRKNKGFELKKRSERFEGFEAVIIQHEVDHLNGRLFTQKILEQKGKLYQITGKDQEGREVFEEVQLNLPA